MDLTLVNLKTSLKPYKRPFETLTVVLLFG